ncbi:MAG: adenosylcobinamide-GDP ribazoletransferase [Paramuribaculum sp.]|nr:adenosylcobinamide-GDP ribazoletransferase [Paramuribaculum sp.]
MGETLKKIVAAFTFFTRIPTVGCKQLESRHFDGIIQWWPLTGFLTGGLTALCYFFCAYLFTPIIAAILALSFRMLVTGALHEDGLADFCDGFGCSGDRDRVLSIMKDSHIGTYGVIGLLLYTLLFILTVSCFPIITGCILIFSSDVWCKFCSSKLIDFLPYSRTREHSKSGILYEKPKIITTIGMGLLSAGTLILLWWPMVLCSIVVPLVVLVLGVTMKKRIGGYTGDCCGATFLISQIMMFLCAMAVVRLV